MRTLNLAFLTFVAILFSFSSVIQAHDTTEPAHNFIVTGVAKNSSNSILLEKFKSYLTKHSGIHLNLVYAKNYTDLSKKMHNDPLAIGWTRGVPYVQDHALYNQQLIAVPTFNQKPTYYSLVLTDNDRTEKTLADFKGDVLAFSDIRSNSGFLSPTYALYKQGIDIKKHFRYLLNARNHEGSIVALLNGLADVAAVDEYIWLSFIKDDPQAKKKLRIVERMGPYPFTPIVASKDVTQTDIKKLTAALVNMKNDDQGKVILKNFVLDGFVEKPHAFYNPIALMLEYVDIDNAN
ncbi:hypothetical protein MNBD_GAMMA08-1422 [hydrothermal vent metagenome]|uniref:Phosphonate ABC transporter phosphate-binding periplasmic component (TC 3.A.1.9.1) n=1 Tax=hydrothermal vent metagenome TaxID=652676 RepID=A0A3B0XYC0_9ZZZZ